MNQILTELQIGDELFWEPLRIVAPDPWVGHIPFAFWLIKALRPEIFVELGTHSGNSYSAFCQAIAAFGTTGRAFAVDTWQGDEHSGSYGDEVFADLATFNAARYRRFSTLLRTTFDDARKYFADGSIDLLHIDGLHTYDAVKHDFENWSTALSQRAVVVFHDTNVREREFGVWRLWRELSQEYPSFEFPHSHGLGVLGAGPDQSELAHRLFELGRDREAAAWIRRWFSVRSDWFQHRAGSSELDQRTEALTKELARLQDEQHQFRAMLAERDQTISWQSNLMQTKEAVVQTKDALLRSRDEALIARDYAIRVRDQIISEKDRSLAARNNDVEQQGRELRARDTALRQREEQVRELEEQLRRSLAMPAPRDQEKSVDWEEVRRIREHVRAEFESSTSWRVTAPLRAAAILFRRGLRTTPLTPPEPQVAELPDETRDPGVPAEPGVSALGAVNLPVPANQPEQFDHKAALRCQLAARLEAFLATDARLRLPRSNAPDISILLVLHNQAELSFGCLTSIIDGLSNRQTAVEVLIFDSGSTDRTADLLDRLDDATVIRSPQNLHFLRSANHIARDATGRNLLFLNNDAQLIPGSIEAAVATLASDKAIGAVGGRLILPDGSLQEAGSIVWRDGTCVGYGRGRNPHDPEFMFRREVDYCSAAFLLTPRSVFEKLGGFDERYSPAYYEDADYCLRLWQAGFSVVFDPNATVLHYEFGSSSAAEEALALQQRNWKLFAERHAAWLSNHFPSAAENALSARSARSAKKVLMIEDRVPKIHLGSGYPRAHDLLQALVEKGAQVTFYPMFRYDETWPELRRSIDPRVEVFVQGSAGQLRAFLESRVGYYDAFLVCRPHNMREFLEAVGPDQFLLEGAKIIYDAEAVFARRDLLRQQSTGTAISSDQARFSIAEEISLSRLAHGVISVSAAERQLFRDHGVDPVYLLGHTLQPRPTLRSIEERREIVFLGAIHDEKSPNADAVLWFATEILPLLREQLGQDLRLRVVGLNQVASVAALDGSSLDLTGPVQDLAPWFENARVMVVPTRFAAGMPHKVHQAAALGVPVVATSLIAEQIGWTPGEDLLAASSPEEFAECCATLFHDSELWERIRRNALDRCREECSPQSFSATVDRILSAIPARERTPPATGEAEGSRLAYAGRPIESDYSFAVPLSYVPSALHDDPALAVICHLFHTQVISDFQKYLANIPFGADLFFSTDSEEKKGLIENAFAEWENGRVEIRIMPNRGRDLAPKLVGFADVYGDYEFVLHLHSKVSGHDKRLALWRGFLLENLLGSQELVYSVFEAFTRHPRLGLLFPQHFEYIRHWLDWGANYDIAQTLAARLGFDLSPQQTIDFPSGSMFWARTAALKPLLDIGLSFADFPREEGQTDGTLGHAIERMFLFVCERAGFSWLKIANPQFYIDTATIVEIKSAMELDRYVAEHMVRLCGPNPPEHRAEPPPIIDQEPPGLRKALQAQRERTERTKRRSLALIH